MINPRRGRLPAVAMLCLLGTAISAAPPVPDAVSRISAADERVVLFEGSVSTVHGLLPDGRVWAFHRQRGEVTLLTPPHLFGTAYFASGGVLLGDDTALVHVNYDDDPANLYIVDLAGDRARYFTDARSLGLEDIDSASLAGSSEGRRLAFSALRMVGPDGGSVAAGGVFTLGIDSPDSLRLEAEAPPYLPLRLRFTDDGRLEVGPRRPSAPVEELEAVLTHLRLSASAQTDRHP